MTVQATIEKQYKSYTQAANRHRKYVEFNVGDLVWIHLREERFPQGKFGKLNQRVMVHLRYLRELTRMLMRSS